MSDLTGAQKATLIDALLSGYTSEDQLAELLDLHLDVKLAEITEDGTLRARALDVVTWAESYGRTKELAIQAQKYRPGNPALGAFVDALYPGERVQPVPKVASPASGPPGLGPPGLGPPGLPLPGLPPPGTEPPGLPRPGLGRSDPRSRRLIYGAAMVVAVLIALAVISLRPWRSTDDGGRSDSGGSGGGTTKDGPRRPGTLRFIELSGLAGQERIVVNARFSTPQLAPGSALWFVVGSGQRCRERIHRAQVDNPSLGYMTSVIKADRARVTCAQLFVEDANGQAIARSDPRDITFQTR
jgi:effector-associated domain 1 (EAD1)-containing protein